MRLLFRFDERAMAWHEQSVDLLMKRNPSKAITTSKKNRNELKQWHVVVRDISSRRM